MNNRTIALIFAGLIVLAIAFFLYNNYKNKQNENEFEPETELVTDQSGYDGMVNNATNEDCEDCPETAKVGISITGDEIINLYAENAELKARLAACEEGKTVATTTSVPTVARTTTRRTTTTRRPATTQSSETTSSTGTSESSRVSSPNIAISRYEGVISGDFGATFDGDGKIFYYVKNVQSQNPNAASLINIKDRNTTETHLNGKTGVLGIQVGDYLIFKTGTVVTADRLEEGEQVKFSIYIGDYLYGSKYDMWLPHEFVKLNKSLATSPGILDNGEGGYAYITKINYKSK